MGDVDLQAGTRRARGALRALEAFGIAVEYMIVDRSSLDVRPLADRALRALQGADAFVAEVERGALGWSNELVLHRLGLRNRDPVASLAGLVPAFASEVEAMDGALAPFEARLMPGGMHPWMDPAVQARLWPHANARIYDAYDRIFDCRRHGWANVQGIHVELPFGDAGEFALVHEAARRALPILPALAASSPFADGIRTAYLDFRMELHRVACAAIPSITGLVVPEPLRSRTEYDAQVLRPMYRAIAPHDPEGVLQHEWLNARGAIARFDRGALEIRVLDAQECPSSDLAIAALTVDLVRLLYADIAHGHAPRTPLPEDSLARVLDACVRDGADALIEHPDYLAELGVRERRCRAGALWRHLAGELEAARAPHRSLWSPFLEVALSEGSLAQRLVAACGATPTRRRLAEAYAELCDCLHSNRMFHP